MSDTYPKQRDIPGNLDFRPRDGGKSSEAAADPLAELARLVGRDDPFKDLFTARDARKPARAGRIEPPPMLPTPEPFDRLAGAPDIRTSHERLFGHDDRSGHPASHDAYGDEGEFHAPLGQGAQDGYGMPAVTGGQHDYAGYHESVDPEASNDGHPLNADLWAQGMPEPVSSDPLHYAPSMDDSEEQGGTRKRTLVVLAAVLALTAGGLGATFLVRGGSAGASSGEPPTILAASGPTKVQPPDTSNQSTGGDGNTALIEKSASDNVNSAKVVNTQERPIDLAQLPKAPDATTQAPTDGRVAVTTTTGGDLSNAFPAPRKVKTVMVRPDGSVIGADAAPAATPLAATTADMDAVPKPATPKTTARATATPRAAAVTPTDTAPARPKPAHTAKPKQMADATPAATTAGADAPATTGGFAVQLAAPSTEQEANEISARLQKKFAGELDGRTPSVRKADNKSVYRVRVGGLSQEDAKGLCAKLQSSGGSCFVVRN